MARGFDLVHLQWKWVLGSMAIFFVAQGLLSALFSIVGVLTLGIGNVLFLVLKPITYFIGGYVTGYLSSNVTLAEPAIGAGVIVLLGVMFDFSHIHAGLFWGLVSAAFAFAVALVGAVFGER